MRLQVWRIQKAKISNNCKVHANAKRTKIVDDVDTNIRTKNYRFSSKTTHESRFPKSYDPKIIYPRPHFHKLTNSKIYPYKKHCKSLKRTTNSKKHSANQPRSYVDLASRIFLHPFNFDSEHFRDQM